MPIIRIDFDGDTVSDNEIEALGAGAIEIMQRLTGIESCFVYANSAQIRMNIAPIEVFIEFSASKIEDRDALFEDIKTELASWREKTGFAQPINLTLKPMDWKFEVNV